jgi:phage terminase small subunit
MKIAALVTVAALACGTAFAQSSSSTTSGDTSATHGKSAAMANDSQPKGEGIVDKTKRAFHRLGEKLKAGSSKSTDGTDKTAQQNPETASMGASGSDKADSSRKSRMDEAYSNSKKSSATDKADK